MEEILPYEGSKASGCPEKWWMLCPWKCSGPNWTGLGLVKVSLAMAEGIGLDGL